jgi:hypothetical protein
MVVEAKDGYRATFAWAELDSSFMDKSVYVVTKRDGKPLSDKDGPFQLLVPGEKRSARWVSTGDGAQNSASELRRQRAVAGTGNAVVYWAGAD